MHSDFITFSVYTLEAFFSHSGSQVEAACCLTVLQVRSFSAHLHIA